jgi:hypothetical protein
MGDVFTDFGDDFGDEFHSTAGEVGGNDYNY